MTNMNIINEPNNNSIIIIKNNNKQLGDSQVDIKGLPGYYKTEERYRPYTIFGSGELFYFIFGAKYFFKTFPKIFKFFGMFCSS